jgi:malonyl-CoA/methylmalonyl-CoA synthetase
VLFRSIATFTADGELRVAGRRATDLIKTGGYKVGAGEVEAALLEHPAVREAAVVGLPDDDLGERIAAFVVTYPGKEVSGETLADHVARLLAPHKRPRVVKAVEALPRNAMGKVLKKQLPDLLR